MKESSSGTIEQWEKAGEWAEDYEPPAAVTRPLRILIVAPSHDILGGQSIHAEQLLKELGKEPQLEVSFMPINPRAPGLLRRLQQIKYVRTIITTLLYCGRLLRRVPQSDIVHVSSASNSSFLISPTPAILIGKLFRRKVVLNYHGGQAEEHLQNWRRTALPTIRLADVTAVQSNFLVDVFARHGLTARAIFNHVEMTQFRFRERKPLRPVFLSNRNFDPIYNVPCVLRAFALIQQRYAEARLTVAGDGVQRAELESLARELKLQNVEFTGLVAPERMPELCDATDIYLNASNVDNMPLSILEAFAAGLPVVTTDAGGIPYIVTDEETGLLVRMNDHQALAAAAIRLLADEALAQKIVAQARCECDKYKWSAVRGEWLKLYDEVMGRSDAVEHRV